MRMRVGTRGKAMTETSDVNVFERRIRRTIYEALGDQLIGISRSRLRKLTLEVDRRVVRESKLMFNMAVRIIQRSKSRAYLAASPFFQALEITAFKGTDLGRGRALMTPRGLSPGGAVNWPELTQSWGAHKRRRSPANAGKFFMYKGSLLSNLKRSDRRDGILRKFGGVQISINEVRADHETRLMRGDAEIVLARLEVQIFPRIPHMLLPMLASSRWTDHSDGGFELAMVGGKMGEKLAGPEGRHRPLLQPLTQFWIAFRYPNAIRGAINKVLKG